MGDNIEQLRAVLQGGPSGHSDRLLYLRKLAISLYNRFKQEGVLSDLDEAISLDRAVLSLHPSGHSNQSQSLNNLAVLLYARFEQRGVLSDLDEAHTSVISSRRTHAPDVSECRRIHAIRLPAAGLRMRLAGVVKSVPVLLL
ncbi:hypothetical protein M405DRAFT_801709 [Rhizopogon salebrosus TDB-379]|nr:hypothetical protein M405DRAFT_801709 [Rhizopogon salebrosus TDB-379]